MDSHCGKSSMLLHINKWTSKIGQIKIKPAIFYLKVDTVAAKHHARMSTCKLLYWQSLTQYNFPLEKNISTIHTNQRCIYIYVMSHNTKCLQLVFNLLRTERHGKHFADSVRNTSLNSNECILIRGTALLRMWLPISQYWFKWWLSAN